MSKRRINKVAVIGSGVMGSAIACHFANIGVQVLLLDIVPNELTDAEKKKGLTLEDTQVRNRIVNEASQEALKSNPSPIYDKKFASRIETGNFDDDMQRIADVDWIIEVVVERLDIKKQVFENVEKFRKPGTLITSNTSGIPIHLMSEGRSEDFQKHFCGTHFFNPPRYLRLLEIIPGPKTDQKVIDFLMEYGSRFLGKETVLCKDTPAFIANRVGVYSIMEIFHLVKDMDLSVEDIDKLTGPVIGHQKSTTFRTADVVGLDTLVHVANGVKDNCKDDERNAVFAIPEYVQKMVDNKWLGSKSGQGFYKKIKGESGKSEILSLDLKTLEYGPQKKTAFPTLEMTKSEPNLAKRLPMLYGGMDKAGEFYRKSFNGLFGYVSHRIPEITDEIYKIDAALCAGFGWKMGPFEKWDAIGVKNALKNMEKAGVKVSGWVQEMLDAGIESFYKIEDGKKYFYDIPSKSYKAVPTLEGQIFLDNITGDGILWKNSR